MKEKNDLILKYISVLSHYDQLDQYLYFSRILLPHVHILLLKYRIRHFSASWQGEDFRHQQHQHINISEQGEKVPRSSFFFWPTIVCSRCHGQVLKNHQSRLAQPASRKRNEFPPAGSPAARRCVVRLTSQAEGSEVNGVKVVDIGAVVSDRDLRL